jgi:hypothetical protein
MIRVSVQIAQHGEQPGERALAGLNEDGEAHHVQQVQQRKLSMPHEGERQTRTIRS